MSLHQLAHHVQSAGRGEDKVLVHMTPKEVSGLQALAMAHGGSLTVNPQTGLPEAGFLSSILPMVAGLALGPAGFGLTAMQAGLATAAVGTAMTGSLGKGLMMGLGAYGGAGLGAGLSSMGTTTPTAAVPQMNVATTGVEGMKSGMYGGQGIFSQGIPPTPTTSALTGVTPQGGMTGLSAYTPPKPIYDMGAGLQRQLTPIPASPSVKPIYNIGETIKYTPPSVATPTANVAARIPSEATVDVAASVPQTQFDKLGAGFKKATGSFQGVKDLYAATEAAAPYAGIAGLGSYALGSYYDKLGKAKQPKADVGLIRPYTYERTQVPGAYDMGAPMYAETPGSSAERNYFADQYTALKPYKAPGPEYAAEGGVMGLAVGGPVEQMSAGNAIGGNTMYPQSQLQTAMYSNPMMQRPMPTDVIQQGLNMPVNTYTGEQKFADGGMIPLVKKLVEPQQSGEYKYSYNPQTMQFTQTAAPTYNPSLLGVVGRAFNANKEPQFLTTPVGTTSGGMAQPMPMQSAQPAYTPPPPPAYQTPEQQLGLTGFYPMMEQRLAALGAAQGYAGGGLSHLGDYSDGGRLLKGPGDGVSDSIPAVIGERQPARLADGEFVIPARIVSELGNGSTEAGARKLYAMMDRVQKARRKTVGKNKVAANTRSEKYLPA